ncbi:MAG: Gfo/Idh/MocA family oxidoreductase [Planctomycetota bacterium]|nr:Gfo/Idh/MocA family oxidoreductase [Planctomycetota bacterium]
MSFGIGIVGCGTIGNVHAAAARRAGISINAAWDVAVDRAELLTSTFGGRACPGLAELLARPDVDAVAIAVPNDRHALVAIQSLRAGKHVLLEKPMAMNLLECDAINAAVRESKKMLQIGFVCRGSPTAQCVKHFLDRGRFGRLTHIKCASYRRRGVPGLGGWFTTKSISGGGALIDLGVHLLDLSLYLAGSPRPLRVSGATFSGIGSAMKDYVFTSMWAGPPKLDGICDVEDGASAFIRCEGGLTIELNVTWAANLPEGHLQDGICVLGERAGASFQIYGREVRIATEEEGRLVDICPHFVCDDPEKQMWDAQYAQFTDAVVRGIAPHACGKSGRRVQGVVEAIYASAASSAEVAVDAS